MSGQSRPAAQALGLDAAALAARLPPLLVAAQRVAATVAQGVHGRRRVGAGDSFWQFRPYVAGDPVARIDWRQAARSGRPAPLGLHVREMEWEAAETVCLWADASPSMHWHSTPWPAAVGAIPGQAFPGPAALGPAVQGQVAQGQVTQGHATLEHATLGHATLRHATLGRVSLAQAAFGQSPLAATTKHHRAVLLLLALAMLLLRGGERVVLPDVDPRPALGRGALERLAAALLAPVASGAGGRGAGVAPPELGTPDGAQFPGTAGTGPHTGVPPPPEAIPRHAKVVLIGDFLGPLAELEAVLAGYAGRAVGGVLLQVLDPAEETLPYTGRIRFDGLEGETPFLAARAEDLRTAYARRLAAQRAGIAALCRAGGFRFAFHRTDRPPETALLALYAALAASPGASSPGASRGEEAPGEASQAAAGSALNAAPDMAPNATPNATLDAAADALAPAPSATQG